MYILALNCGSSSLKYRVYRFPDAEEVAGGEAERIGPPTDRPARIIHRCGGVETVHEIEMPDHSSAFDRIDELLAQSELRPDAIGHRMVHGGEEFQSHALVTDEVMPRLRSIQDLAPLHNPPAMNLLDACRHRYPEVPQAVIFDTVFHASIPEHARTYALPRQLTRELGLRKYGFHGISHQYVTRRAAELLGTSVEKFNGVSCHLGSGGASLCAVREGRSVDNTMGVSPLQGLIMSTRSGDLDPAAVLRLLDHFQNC
jgi:acetate kinase